MDFCCIVQAGGQGVSASFASGGIAAPAAGFHPLLAIAGGIHVEGEENHLIAAELLAERIGPAAALREGDVFALGYQEAGIDSKNCEAFVDLSGEEAVVGIFAEEAVRALFAGGVEAVAVVEEDDHCVRRDGLSDRKLDRICGNKKR